MITKVKENLTEKRRVQIIVSSITESMLGINMCMFQCTLYTHNLRQKETLLLSKVYGVLFNDELITGVIFDFDVRYISMTYSIYELANLILKGDLIIYH